MGLFDKLKKRVKDTEVTEEKKASESASVKSDSAKPKKDAAPKAKKAEPKKDKKETKKKAPKAKVTEDILRVIVEPDVTEKSAIHQESNVYVFKVDRNADKKKIKRAVEARYQVNVESVRIINRKGKTVRNYRWKGQQKDMKKALVRIPSGENIQIFEQEEVK